MRGTGPALEKANGVALRTAALAGKTSLLAAPGAPKGLVARGRTGVNFTVFGAAATVKWYGPVHLVNNPTKPHELKPKARRGGKALRLADGHFRSHVEHPGTDGKHFFEAGEQAAAQAIPPVFRTVYRGQLARYFGG